MTKRLSTPTRQRRALVATSLLGAAIGLMPAVATAQEPAAVVRGGPRSGDARRLHDAARGVRGGHPAVPGHARPGRASSSRSRTAVRATRAARSRRACRPTSWRWRCGPTSSGSSSPASCPPDWDENEHAGIVHNSVVVARRPPRATPRASLAGTTSSARTSTSSRRTRSRRAARSGTSSLPTRPRSRPARPRKRRASS